MGAAHRLRMQVAAEDAADGCHLFAVRPDPLDDAEPLEDERHPWRCEGCAQRWPADEIACGYCGLERMDI